MKRAVPILGGLIAILVASVSPVEAQVRGGRGGPARDKNENGLMQNNAQNGAEQNINTNSLAQNTQAVQQLTQQQQQQSVQLAQQMIKQFDVDGDGALNANELHQALMAYNVLMRRNQHNAALNAMQQNGLINGAPNNGGLNNGGLNNGVDMGNGPQPGTERNNRLRGKGK